jgi:NAD(P)-dependent dehydrogenase (short-subunit alcohol dehydrogenase family)
MQLEGRKAIVTGAADGIGAATAAILVERGASVLAVDIQGQRLADAHGTRPKTFCLEQDVAASHASQRIVQQALERLGGIDILVCNAGIAAAGELSSTADAEWQRVLEINLASVFRLCREAIPQLENSAHARIIATGSILSSYTSRGLGVYTVSKHGVAGLMRSLALELGPKGITANWVQPGTIVTGISRDAFASNAQLRDYWLAKACLGRLGEPIDVARVIAFLASDDSGYVTGQGIFVDGGVSNWQ